MAATKTAGAANGARVSRAPAGLPIVTVAHFEQAAFLIERLVEENTDVFIEAGQRYRARHRHASTRPLTALEVGQVAAGLGLTLAQATEGIAEAGLVARDEPHPQEYLLAAGVATAPAFMRTVMRLVSLLELPPGDLEEACEAGRLDDALDERVAVLRLLPLVEARERAVAVLAHLAQAAGTQPGKAWGLVVRSVWQALEQAMGQLTIRESELGSQPSISSPASTDGPGEPSSTTPPGETPGSS